LKFKGRALAEQATGPTFNPQFHKNNKNPKYSIQGFVCVCVCVRAKRERREKINISAYQLGNKQIYSVIIWNSI
jgi:hypothetical protein